MPGRNEAASTGHAPRRQEKVRARTYVGLQLLSLNGTGPAGADAVRVVFERLGAKPPPDPASFLAVVAALARKSREAAAVAEGWQYVTVNGQHYAWDGRLSDMQDRDPELTADKMDPTLAEAFKERGLRCSWKRPETVPGSGSKRVYLTDLRSWRRAIQCGDTVLTVCAPPNSG